MNSRRKIGVGIGVGGLALIALVVFAPRGASGIGAMNPILALAATPVPSLAPNPGALLKRTGGPYISSAEAVEVAKSRAGLKGAAGKPDAPVGQQAVIFVPYGDVVAWSRGSRTYDIDLLREMYLVVFNATYIPTHAPGTPVPCHWVAVVVDATTGTPWELHCGAPDWPATLPMETVR